MGFSVVVLEGDPRVAQSLAGELASRFHPVHVAHSGDELRERVVRNRPGAIVLDLEHSRLTDVRSLHHDFPALQIVCTHRIPDEELWIAALEAGASDVCRADDVQDVLSSLLRSAPDASRAAA